jgi:hypothetical protein
MDNGHSCPFSNNGRDGCPQSSDDYLKDPRGIGILPILILAVVLNCPTISSATYSVPADKWPFNHELRGDMDYLKRRERGQRRVLTDLLHQTSGRVNVRQL